MGVGGRNRKGERWQECCGNGGVQRPPTDRVQHGNTPWPPLAGSLHLESEGGFDPFKRRFEETQLDKRSSYQEYGSSSVRWSSTVANRGSSPVGHQPITDRKRLVQILVSVLMIVVGGGQPCCSYSASSLQNY